LSTQDLLSWKIASVSRKIPTFSQYLFNPRRLCSAKEKFSKTLLLRFTGDSVHRCDKRLQRLQKKLCKRVYYFVNVYLNKNHMSEMKQNYDSDEDN